MALRSSSSDNCAVKTEGAIKNIKSGLMQSIYGNELQLIYAEKTIKRDKLKAESKKAVEQLVLNIASGELQNESLVITSYSIHYTKLYEK